MLWVGLGLAAALGTVADHARAAPPREPPAAEESAAPRPEDLLPLSEFEEDPIGVGDSRSAPQPERRAPPPATPPDAAEFGPEPPPVTARGGPVVYAVPGVREAHHRMRVHLGVHHARVTIEQRFTHRLNKPAEVRHRLPLPPGARITALEVCSPHGCRAARPVSDAAADRVDAYDAAVLARPADGTRSPPLPVGRAHLATGPDGPVLTLDMAPVSEAAPLTARLSLLLPVAQHGGRVHLRWPARGMDPQTAPTEVQLVPDGLTTPRVDGQQPAGADHWLTRDPWRAMVFTATRGRTPTLGVSLGDFPCADEGEPGPKAGGVRCARVQVDAPPRPLQPVDAILALDVSPSMEGPARSRMAATLAALLETFPAGSRVRALLLAGRAAPLLPTAMPPASVSLTALSPATRAAELGSATRLRPAFALAQRWWRADTGDRLPRVLVLVGDGGLTLGEPLPLRAARRANVQLTTINLADRPTRPALVRAAVETGGTVVEAGAEAARAMRGQPASPLRSRLSGVFAERVTPPLALPQARRSPGSPTLRLPGLRAGQQLIWQGPIRGAHLRLRVAGRAHRSRSLRRAPGADDTWLAVPKRGREHSQDDWPEAPTFVTLRPNGRALDCDRRGPATRRGGLNDDAEPLELAFERRCRKPDQKPDGSPPVAGKGVPASPLLQMLRERIIPVARGCLRRDRAGRADYSVRAVYRFTLAEREVVDASVHGAIAAPLRRCLAEAIDNLLVPSFSGTVIVKYPIRTARETLPAQIELSAGAARELEALLEGAPD